MLGTGMLEKDVRDRDVRYRDVRNRDVREECQGHSDNTEDAGLFVRSFWIPLSQSLNDPKDTSQDKHRSW